MTSTGSWSSGGTVSVRYADDGRIYLASERAGQRVMESVTQYVEQRLKLKVNREKSVVDRATKRPLLGFGFLRRNGRVTIRIDSMYLGGGTAVAVHLGHRESADFDVMKLDQDANHLSSTALLCTWST